MNVSRRRVLAATGAMTAGALCPGRLIAAL